MRTVVLRVVGLALLLLLALVAVITTRTLQRIPDMMIYMVRDQGATFTLESVPRRFGGGDLQTRVGAQVAALASGPLAEEASRGLETAVPADAVVRSARLVDGVLSVDLNAAFERGGGSASMFGRLNQLYYTLSQPTDVEAVTLSIEGRVVEVFGGEGILLDVPWVRAGQPGLPVW